MPSLRDLEARFVRYKVEMETKEFQKDDGTSETRTAPQIYWVYVDTLAEAQGVTFLCPKCFVKNGGNKGTHGVMCWFKDRGVPDDADPLPGRWNPQGTGMDDLTFIGPGAHSVLLTGGGCDWHGFVKSGSAE